MIMHIYAVTLSCLVWLMLVFPAASIKRKRALTLRGQSNAAGMNVHRNRSLDDWQALSRPALLLIINQHHLNSTGSTADIAHRLHEFFQSSPAPENTDTTSTMISQLSTPRVPTFPTNNNINHSPITSCPDISNLIVPPLTSHDLNHLREEMTSLVGTQINNAMQEMKTIFTDQLQQLTANLNIPPATTISNQPPTQVHNQLSPIQLNSPSNFQLPSLSASNLAAIRQVSLLFFILCSLLHFLILPLVTPYKSTLLLPPTTPPLAFFPVLIGEPLGIFPRGSPLGTFSSKPFVFSFLLSLVIF